MKLARTVLLGCVGLAAAHPALADLAPEVKKACHEAYEQGQRLKRAGRLKDARAAFLVCSRDPCPSAFQPECVSWLDEAEKALPSVVPRVAHGDTLLTDVRISMDGVLLADKLDGREISIDPGEHTFRVEAPGYRPIEKRLLLVEGDKAHSVTFDMLAVPSLTSLAVHRKKPAPWSAVTASSIAAAAAASFAYFGATGLARREDVLNICQQHCSASDISYTQEHFAIADVSLGVALVSAAFATYFWIRWAHPGSPSPASASLPFVVSF
jgi:hypothetical protein